MNRLYKQLCVAALHLIFFMHLSAARVIPGDSSGPESFTFALGPSAHTENGSVLYVGARQSSAKAFALSGFISGSQGFIPYAVERATVNGQEGQTNPLFDAIITQLGLFGVSRLTTKTILKPIAVTQSAPANIVYVQEVRQSRCDDGVEVCADVIVAENVKDATGVETTQGILGLQRFEQEAIFAPVLPHDSNDFGQPGSGVAVIKLEQTNENNCIQAQLVQIDAQPEPPMEGVTRASQLDLSSDFLKINNDLASIENTVALHYSSRLKRLYVGLQVKADGGANDGTRSVAVGRLVDEKLHFSPIAPDAVFVAQDGIVGALGADAEVSAHHVRTMVTSTGLDYLIVVGGNGAPAQTDSSVFALPLVNTTFSGFDQEIQGTLANVNEPPEEFFSQEANASCNTIAQAMLGRAFVVPATMPDQIYTDADVQARVGGGDIFGDITDITVSNDAVFISVANTINDQKPGIFYSQALFDDNGAIKAWTPWQRVAGTVDKVFAFSYEAHFGGFTWLTGPSSLFVKTVQESQWGTGAEDSLANLTDVLSGLLPQACGGIQGFFDKSYTWPGLFDISLFIATGLEKVVLVESGFLQNGALCPNFGDFQTNAKAFDDGQITENFPSAGTKVVSISGGALEGIGPIIAAEIGVDDLDDQGYLFVGGACGLAVLAQEDGTGWPTASALGQGFDGLVDGMRFIPLGSYCFVRKLIFDDGFLYVLTDTRLDRIDIALSDFSTGTLSVVTVATLEDILQPAGTLLDVAVSQKFALLATSVGLFRVGNGADIQAAVDNEAVNWTPVVIPEGLPVVRQLQTLAGNNSSNGFALENGGNVYALDAYRGLLFGQENRYTVNSVLASDVDDETIQPLPDMKIKNIFTAFARFGDFRNLIYFDGTDNFSTRDRVQMNCPFVRNRMVVLPLAIQDGSIISSIQRSSASGAWLISGDFGLRINE